MTDARFPTPGQDTRFPAPVTDTRFPSPGVDTRFTGSQDSRFGDLVRAALASVSHTWWDFTDRTTMFGDIDGVVNDPAAGDPVGFITDKAGSLGPELITDIAAQLSIGPGGESGSLTVDTINYVDGGGAHNVSWPSGPLTLGATYRVSFNHTLTSATARPNLRVGQTGTTDVVNLPDGQQEYIIKSEGTGFLFRIPSGATGTITNLSIKEVLGDHLAAPADGSRPLLLPDVSSQPELVPSQDMNDWGHPPTPDNEFTATYQYHPKNAATTLTAGKQYYIEIEYEILSGGDWSFYLRDAASTGSFETPFRNNLTGSGRQVFKAVTPQAGASGIGSVKLEFRGASNFGTIRVYRLTAREIPASYSAAGLQFDGVDDSLTADPFTGAADSTVFVVLETTDDRVMLINGHSDSRYLGAADSGSTSTQVYNNAGTPTAHANNSPESLTRGDFHAEVADGSPTIAEFRGSDLSNWDDFRLSGYVANAEWRLSGTIKEVIVVNEALTDLQRDQIRAALDFKHSIGVPNWSLIYSILAGDTYHHYDMTDRDAMFTATDGSDGGSPLAEDPVGLVLDQGQWNGQTFAQVMMGQPELAPAISTATLGAGWSVDGETATKVAGSGSGLDLAVAFEAGKTYQVNVTLIPSVGSMALQARGTSTEDIATALGVSDGGALSFVYAAVSGNTTFRAYAGSSTEGTVANVSIKEIPGNILQAPADGSRPLLLPDVSSQPELLPDGAWGNQDGNISSAVEPDGRLRVDMVGGSTYVHKTITGLTPGQTYFCEAEFFPGTNVATGQFTSRDGIDSDPPLGGTIFSSDRKKRFYATPTGTSLTLRLVGSVSATPAHCFWGNISLKEIPMDYDGVASQPSILSDVWTLTNATFENGTFDINTGSTENVGEQNPNIEIGAIYSVSFDVSVVSGSVSVFLGALNAQSKVGGANISSSGSYTFLHSPTSANDALVRAEGGFVGTISNLTMKKVQPLYQGGGVLFDGVDDGYELASQLTGVEYVAAVVRVSAGTEQFDTLMGEAAEGNQIRLDDNIRWRDSTGDTVNFLEGDGTVAVNGVATDVFTTGEVHIAEFVAGNLAPKTFAEVGGSINAARRYFKGEIVELIAITGAAPTTAQQDGLRAILATKYGITLP